jgi:hypothetical protein
MLTRWTYDELVKDRAPEPPPARLSFEFTGCAVVGTRAVGEVPSLCLEVRRGDGVSMVWSGRWSRATKLQPSTSPVVVYEGRIDVLAFNKSDVRPVNADGKIEGESHLLTQEEARSSIVVTLIPERYGQTHRTVARVYLPRERVSFLDGSNDASTVIPPPVIEGEGDVDGVVHPEPSIGGLAGFALLLPITLAIDIAITPIVGIGFGVYIIATGGRLWQS